MFNFLFCCKRKNKAIDKVPKFAGYFFTNGTHVLAGYQVKNSNPIISGIGGKIEAGETWQQAAVREVFEELLDVEVPNDLVVPIPTRIIKNGLYIFAVSTFEDLEVFLGATTAKQSPYYEEAPRTIMDLILKRKRSTDQEVQQLVLLPVMSQPYIIDPEFLNDISLVTTKI